MRKVIIALGKAMSFTGVPTAYWMYRMIETDFQVSTGFMVAGTLIFLATFPIAYLFYRNLHKGSSR
jgi:Ca2+/Na+ antiporter